MIFKCNRLPAGSESDPEKPPAMNNTTVDQLLVDEGFLAWYRASDKEQLSIWDAWIQENEENRMMAMEAVRLLNMLYFKETLGASDKRADEIWKRIEKEIAQRTPAPIRRNKESSPLLLSNYMKVAVRNLRRGKMHSVINIAGLSVGMAVSLLIGFWIWDELSFNKFHEHYDRIAQVMERGVAQNGTKFANYGTSIPVAQALRDQYAENFDHVVLMSNGQHTLGNSDNKFTTYGSFMEPEGPEMLSLQMLKGSWAGLGDPSSILLSESMAQKLFKDGDPIGHMVKMDNSSRIVLKVTGVYKDLPRNDDWQGVNFIVPWQEFLDKWDWIRGAKDNWNENICRLVVQLAPNVTLAEATQKIRYVKQKHITDKGLKLDLFLYPMSKWHLYSEFKDGYSSGGLITFVWLFGTIGAFVLLLACINFMNLSTARSEKRAREVGIRKVMGSMRRQLIFQFFSESVLTAASHSCWPSS
jgi:putative ABC transport system permease protein